jgi:hypothetical protein
MSAMKTQRTVLVVSLLLPILAAGSCAPDRERPLQQPLPLTTLSTELGPLQQAFNRDAGKTRLLLLLSPT